MTGELQRVQKLAKRRGYEVLAPPQWISDAEPEIAGKYWISVQGWILPVATTPAGIETFLNSEDATVIARARRRCVAIERELGELIVATDFILHDEDGYENATELAIGAWEMFADAVRDWGGDGNRDLIASLVEEFDGLEAYILRVRVGDDYDADAADDDDDVAWLPETAVTS